MDLPVNITQMLDNVGQLLKGTYTAEQILNMDIPFLNAVKLARMLNNEEERKMLNQSAESHKGKFTSGDLDIF